MKEEEKTKEFCNMAYDFLPDRENHPWRQWAIEMRGKYLEVGATPPPMVYYFVEWRKHHVS